MKYVINLTYNQGNIQDLIEDSEYASKLKWANEEGIEVDNHGNILLQTSTEVMQYLIEYYGDFEDKETTETRISDQSFEYDRLDNDDVDYYIDDDGCIIY